MPALLGPLALLVPLELPTWREHPRRRHRRRQLRLRRRPARRRPCRGRHLWQACRLRCRPGSPRPCRHSRRPRRPRRSSRCPHKCSRCHQRRRTSTRSCSRRSWGWTSSTTRASRTRSRTWAMLAGWSGTSLTTSRRGSTARQRLSSTLGTTLPPTSGHWLACFLSWSQATTCLTPRRQRSTHVMKITWHSSWSYWAPCQSR
mmetsp:Transcript_76159/g.210138  ORF Transcript_76159/g.210138 Transcript_76159/m.210138 type:complete len:202 (-) Transcript_76159:527-1132(-)